MPVINLNARKGESYWDWRLRVERAGGPSTAPRPEEPRDSIRNLLRGDDAPKES